MAATKNSPKRIRNRYLPQTPLELLMLCILCLLGAILWFQDVNFVLRAFYSEYSIVILLLLLLEFLILKSFDRSQVYKSELAQLHQAHREELIIARRMEGLFENLIRQIDDSRGGEHPAALDPRQIRELAQNALNILRSR